MSKKLPQIYCGKVSVFPPVQPSLHCISARKKQRLPPSVCVLTKKKKINDQPSRPRLQWTFPQKTAIGPVSNGVRQRPVSWCRLEVDKNIDSSIDSGKQQPPTIAVLCQMPLSPRLQQLKAPRSRPHSWPCSRVGGWCTMETPSEMRRRVADVWHTALAEAVNSQRSQSHPDHCTVRPRVALLRGERGVFSVNVLLPHVQPEGGGTTVMSMFMSDKNVPCSPRNNGTFSA